MKRNTVKLASVLFILSFAIGTASAQTTITVTTWAELTGAPGNTAVSGDTVVLAAGIYTATSTFNMTEGVVYQGVGDATVIEPAAGVRPFQAPLTVNPPVTTNVGTWTLKNLKFRNVTAQQAFRAFATDGNATGGGELFSPQTVNLANIVFENCTSTADGGAVQFRKGIVTIANCTFTNCTSTGHGGAIFGGTQGDTTCTVVGCTFINCDVTNGRDGGAIKMQSANNTLNVTGCTFTDCDAEDDAGAIFKDNAGTLNITDSTFTDCDGEDGGAIYVTADGSTVNITDSTFTNNSSTEDGGALFTQNVSTVTVDGCTFDGNRNIGDGAVETSEGGHINVRSASSLVVTDSIFLNGSTLHREGAINMQSDAAIKCHIINCLIANNTSPGRHAVSLKGDDIKLVNNTIVGNAVGDTGEGVVRFFTDAEVTGLVISNNIFMNNSGADNVIRYWPLLGNPANAALAAPLTTISNNCFFGNTLTAGTVLVEGSDVDGGTLFTETGRITADPALNADYKPTSASTAIIDAADVAHATASDLEGVPAFGVRDVGAYEFAPPLAPTNLTAVLVGMSVLLDWDPVNNADGYKVERADAAAGPWSEIAQTAADSFLDNMVVGDSSYYYRVIAFNGAGDSPPSNEVGPVNVPGALGTRDWHLYR